MSPILRALLVACVVAWPIAVQAQTTPAVASSKSSRGHEAAASRAALGITLHPNDASGAVVASVIPGTPAAEAKLQIGDRILSINEEPVAGHKDVTRLVRTYAPGSSIYLRIDRQGLEGTLRAELASEADVKRASQAMKPEPPVEVIRAKRFEVVADDGTVLATFGQVHGTGSLGIYDRDGKLQFVVSGSKHGGIMALTDGNRQVVRVGATADGGVVEVLDDKRQPLDHPSETQLSQDDRFGTPSR